MFTYSQTTGVLTHNGYAVSKGYAGRGEGLNNPAMQNVPKIGPLPQGKYTIMKAGTDAKVGKVAMRLIPDPANEMYDRADFFIHAPHANDQKDSSEGCMVFDHDTRTGVAAAVAQGDNQLLVTE